MALAHPTSTREEERRAAFTTALTAWYDPTLRPFKWRDSSDLYFVTVCEVLPAHECREGRSCIGGAFLRFPSTGGFVCGRCRRGRAYLSSRSACRAGLVNFKSFLRFAHSQRRARAFPEELRELLALVHTYSAATRVLALWEVDAVIDEHVLCIFRRVPSIPAPARRHPTRAPIVSRVELEWRKQGITCDPDLGRFARVQPIRDATCARSGLSATTPG